MSDADRKPRRRWLQFGLRTALCLVVVVALGLGWWRDRAEMKQRIERLELMQEAQLLLQASPSSVRDRSRSFSRSFAARQFGNRGDYQVEPLPEFRDAVMFSARGRSSPFPFAGQEPTPQVDGAEIVPTLIGILAEDDAQRRAQAASTLAMLGEQAAPAVGELQRLLADPDPAVRWHAVLALGQIGPDAAPAAGAVRKLIDDDESGMPAFAAQMLLKIEPDAEIGQRLASLLAHRKADTRRRALAALMDLDQDSNGAAMQALVPALVGLLDDEDENTRTIALDAVARLAPRDAALEAITRVFRHDEDERVRRLAAQHLIRLQTEGETEKNDRGR